MAMVAMSLLEATPPNTGDQWNIMTLDQYSCRGWPPVTKSTTCRKLHSWYKEILVCCLWKVFRHSHLQNCLYNCIVYCDVLTVTGWITACPHPITDILAGTHVISTQCVARVTSIGGSCSYNRRSSLWLVAH